MASSKLLLASIAVVALLIAGARSDASVKDETAGADASESALRSEIEGLRSRISALESSIEDKIREAKAKEDSIARLNGLIQEKLSKIASLESEIESLQKKGAIDVKSPGGKADARLVQLEKQIAKLRADIEAQAKKKDALATRTSTAEKKVEVLNLKLGRLQSTNEEQKLQIQKSQRALELAEEELLRAKLDAVSRKEELTKVHGAWFPPWLATHITHIQDVVLTQWSDHGKQSLELILQKAAEKSQEVRKWAEPHFHAAKTDWVPAAKSQLLMLKTNAAPYLRKIFIKSYELYEESKSTIGPHIVKLREVADPYFQKAKVFSEPYIRQMVTFSKPYIEKLQLRLKPYKKRVARTYRKSLRTARTFHRQVQNNIHKELLKHELTKPHATKEITWFLASVFLAFPFFFLYRILATVFSKKPQKSRRARHSSHSHTHRRPKRRHADN